MQAGSQSQYLVFTISGKLIGTKLAYVKRVVELKKHYKVPLSCNNYEGIIKFEGKVIPLFSLKKAMQLTRSSIDDDGFVVVENHRGVDIGLLISEVKQVINIDPNYISQSEGEIAGIKQKVLWDGNIIYIIDTEELIFEKTFVN